MNRIDIDKPIVKNNIIHYNYKVYGDWTEAFRDEEDFTIEYGCDISGVPSGILIIPLLANILPIAWIYDAEIKIPVCDFDFYECMKNVKDGYKKMFPMMSFDGSINVDILQHNIIPEQEGAVAFFSGGLDSFCTLIQHRSDKPSLITLWGSDVKLEDKSGWNKVQTHIEEVSELFSVSNVLIKSKFRLFLNERQLSRKVRISGDGWWHGFQHGIGIISHAAPIMYAMKKKTIFFASSFTAADRGKITCASDPSIDNEIRFCGVDIVHDGYDLNRQEKIHVITQFSDDNHIQIPLRVCWESEGGSNCCHCEKCWRTILGIYAAGYDPRQYGFQYESLTKLGKEIKQRRSVFGIYKDAQYAPIWSEIKKNYTRQTRDPGLKWFYTSRFSELETGTKCEQAYRKTKKIAGKVKRKLKRLVSGR